MNLTGQFTSSVYLEQGVVVVVMVVVVAFSSLARFFGGRFGDSFPACAILLFFFKVEISSRIPISLFRPGSVHSVSAS